MRYCFSTRHRRSQEAELPATGYRFRAAPDSELASAVGLNLTKLTAEFGYSPSLVRGNVREAL